MKLRHATLWFALVATPAFAKTFRTQFIKLELPPNWDCKQEEIDWVCQPDNLAERSEAIVIVATKAVNEVDDNFPKYMQVLNEPRAMRDLLGNAYKSQVVYVRERAIKGQNWIDSLQVGSEIPGFRTRYVASIKEKVAGLITYSVAESVYAKYAPVLDAMIDSAEIFFDPKAFAEAMKSGPGSLLGPRGGKGGARLAPLVDNDSAKKNSSQGMDVTQVAGALLALGAVSYILWKRKKGGNS